MASGEFYLFRKLNLSLYEIRFAIRGGIVKMEPPKKSQKRVQCVVCRGFSKKITKCVTCNLLVICEECWLSHSSVHKRCSKNCVAVLSKKNAFLRCSCGVLVHDSCKKGIMCVMCITQKRMVRCRHDGCLVEEVYSSDHAVKPIDGFSFLWRLEDYDEKKVALRKCFCNDSCENFFCSEHCEKCKFCKKVMCKICFGSHMRCSLCLLFDTCCDTSTESIRSLKCTCGSGLTVKYINTFVDGRCQSRETKFCCKCFQDFLLKGIGYGRRVAHKEHPLCHCGKPYCGDMLSGCASCKKIKVHDDSCVGVPLACIDCPQSLDVFPICCDCKILPSKIKTIVGNHTMIPIDLVSIIGGFFEPMSHVEHVECEINGGSLCKSHVRSCVDCKTITSERNLVPCGKCGKKFCPRCIAMHIIVAKCGCALYQCNKKYIRCGICPTKELISSCHFPLRNRKKGKTILTKVCCKCFVN